MTQAIELLEQLRSGGVSVSLDHDELVLCPGSKVPDDVLAEVRHHKVDLVALLTPIWPPTDADGLISRWNELDRPEIPLSPGVSISDLAVWLHPAIPIEHMAEHLEIVRRLIKGQGAYARPSD